MQVARKRLEFPEYTQQNRHDFGVPAAEKHLVRITFLLPFASIAGGVRVAAIYAQKLAERGHEVTVVSRRGMPPPSFRQRLARKLRNPRAKFRNKAASPQLDFLGNRHVVIDTFHPLDPDVIPDADIIIATWWETAFAAAALPPSKGRKFYFVQHHEVHGHLPAHISAGSYYLPLKKIAISQWLVDTMAETYGDRDVTLIENSVDMEMFHAPARGRQARPTVGLLYATNPFKGVDTSLEAIRIARERVPDLHVVAFGAKRVSPNLPLPEGSRYVQQPPQAEIRNIYASCDVWLCGSRAEGFHLPPSEAMACRCPVVSTRVGGAVEIVTEGMNGHIVDVEDAAALGDRLADVLCLPEDRWKAMSDAAYARARSYSWDDAADRFEATLAAG